MQYWQLVSRSFAITWRHRYLWLLALFAGESGGGVSANSSTYQPIGQRGKPGSTPDFGAIQQQIVDWYSQHLGLIVGIAVLFVILTIAFFVLAAVCEGAVVRASAEHDAERPFGLGVAWRCGVATMGSIIRLRLLLLALGLPVFIVLVALAAGLVAAIIAHNVGAAVAAGLVLLLLVLAAIPYGIYLGFLTRLGARAVVLEQLGARAALVRSHRLVFKRLGRVLVVWLLSIAISIGLGIATGLALAVLLIPAALLGVFAYTSGSAVLWIVVALLALILIAVLFVVEGFVLAQGSTYWTLAFRRLEIDQPPVVYGYQYAQAAPPSTA